MLGSTFAKDLLVNEKAPYVVTLFIAALAWTAIRTADRLASIPFVEYRVAPAVTEAGVAGIDIRLRNITTASKFDCFLLTLVPRRHETLKLGSSTGQQHQLHGTVLATLTVKKAKENEWEIEVTNLAPGADISIVVPASGEGSPAVLGSPCTTITTMSEPAAETGDKGDKKDKQDKPKPPPDAVPILVPQSARTFFVEYEITMLWSALGVWLVLMIVLPSMRASGPAERRRSAVHVVEGKHDVQDSID